MYSCILGKVVDVVVVVQLQACNKITYVYVVRITIVDCCQYCTLFSFLLPVSCLSLGSGFLDSWILGFLTVDYCLVSSVCSVFLV